MLDVVLFCEGTYPYVAGGVSSWIHMLVSGMPDLKFGLVYLAPSRDLKRKLKYQLPPNVVDMLEVYLYDKVPLELAAPSRKVLPADHPAWQAAAQLFRGLLNGQVENFSQLLPAFDPHRPGGPQLGAKDLATAPQSWQILLDLYQERAADFPFSDFFWNYRFIIFPLLGLLQAPLPQAKLYHTVTTGWSGFLGVLAKLRHGRPLLLTEHGIYTHERRIEIVKANWLYVEQSAGRQVRDFGVLKTMWINLFNALSRLCYQESQTIFTLFGGNRKKQISAGAPPEKVVILPNGVAIDPSLQPRPLRRPEEPFTVGFIGRVVPIKDVKTLIYASQLLKQSYPHCQIYIIGPSEEDEDYAQECRTLANGLGLEGTLHFMGPQNVKEWYPRLDVQVLTSVSEGQPLVILEGFCYGVPCVSTDVGACSELILGGEESDRQLGAAGFITPVGDPGKVAAALLQMAQQPQLAHSQGQVGFRRVRQWYDLKLLLSSMHQVYLDGINGAIVKQ